MPCHPPTHVPTHSPPHHLLHILQSASSTFLQQSIVLKFSFFNTYQQLPRAAGSTGTMYYAIAEVLLPWLGGPPDRTLLVLRGKEVHSVDPQQTECWLGLASGWAATSGLSAVARQNELVRLSAPGYSLVFGPSSWVTKSSAIVRRTAPVDTEALGSC